MPSGTIGPSGSGSELKQLGWVLAATVAVAASLLTFPIAIAWMIGAWLVCHTALVLRGRAGWLPLADCAAVVAVKRVGWPSSLIMLVLIMAAVGAVRGLSLRGRGRRQTKPLVWIGLVVLWATWAAFTLDWQAAARCGRHVALDGPRPVVCLGDSLTAYGYPRYLARIVAIPVINLGVDGITSGDALTRLPALVESNPQVVVIELGGHDYLRGHTRATTMANLQKIVDACRGIEAEVILMEVPRGFVRDPFVGLERELARRNDLELIPDTPIRQFVLWSPHAPPGMWFDSPWHLSEDGLHPNERGNRLLARRVADALARLYGPNVRRRPPGD